MHTQGSLWQDVVIALPGQNFPVKQKSGSNLKKTLGVLFGRRGIGPGTGCAAVSCDVVQTGVKVIGTSTGTASGEDCPTGGLFEWVYKFVPVMRFGDLHEVLWIVGNGLTKGLGRVRCQLEAERVWSVVLHGGTCRDSRGGTQLSRDSSELRGCHASNIQRLGRTDSALGEGQK